MKWTTYLHPALKLENVWICIFAPPYVFMVWCLVNQRICLNRDHFTDNG